MTSWWISLHTKVLITWQGLWVFRFLDDYQRLEGSHDVVSFGGVGLGCLCFLGFRNDKLGQHGLPQSDLTYPS